MKYFIDTEFHEYKKKPTLGKAIDTIELISIGIVSEDGREYYAVSREFNVAQAWSNEWLRNNVLLSVYLSLVHGDARNTLDFSYSTMSVLIKECGLTKNQIAEGVAAFIDARLLDDSDPSRGVVYPVEGNYKRPYVVCTQDVQFYGFYADYDWVVFCWLFGRMIDLPTGFPMYCRDLKQMLDDKLTGSMVREGQTLDAIELVELRNLEGIAERLEWIKKHSIRYPKQGNEHNALDDARWNKKLYDFIISL